MAMIPPKASCVGGHQVPLANHCVSEEGRRGKMYGMLLESVQHYVKTEHGEEVWRAILEHIGLRNTVFNTHGIYPDRVMLDLSKACSKVIGDRTSEEYLQYFGQCFVKFFSHYGYDKIVRISGRHYRDFLKEIDNLHETMRFTFPRMHSPSFNVSDEDVDGCVLVYRSKRKGFTPYVIGQLCECASQFYNINVTVSKVTQSTIDIGYHTQFRLNFKNSAYREDIGATSPLFPSQFPTLSANTLFKIFPFCIVFDENMVIRHMGTSLPMLLESYNLIGSEFPTRFLIRRPLIDCTWNNVKRLQRVTFEVQYRSPVHRLSNASLGPGNRPQASKVLLRGQVKFMEDWNMMVFLCTPLISGLTDLEKMGLYISDLNMYDNSRQMVMTGWQHSSVLEYSIEQQVKQSEKISETMRELDDWQHNSNMLLYNMIPETIAKDLKEGVDPIKTCQVFDDVTILFSYLVDFNLICARGTPLQIVQCINNIFTVFDNVVDKHGCFKVETLGDAVYMVAGGVPDRRPNHAHQVAGLALDLLQLSNELHDPTTGKSLQFRLGMHTGGVVGGVIGRRMPQYCLFGDTVNTASRMQSHGKPGKIHLSEQCHQHLIGSSYIMVSRGTINVKGKGDMETYWLIEDAKKSGNIEGRKQ
ncbi:soluble guanylate cyclase 88E-like [Pecten maximus]|uniref:soluble guanylate cyclase 88E-like n=1 Tax=Pecten maximus TaxID=6579 RepID=UPI0014583F5A|nr:soluble guanylate cyclase 88E-like [Pecten maximus]